MHERPDRELEKIYSFLDVPANREHYEPKNVRSYREPMKESTRERLLAHFRPFNERLIQFLGYPLPEWDV
jgi:hypothetical protein